MRDLNNFTIDFDLAIKQRVNSSVRRIEKLAKGEIDKERINIVKRDMSSNFLFTALTKYSIGHDFKFIEQDLMLAISYCYESWDGFWKLRTGEPNGSIILNQYILSAYDEMLWMLSLGYLLNIENDDFKKLVDVIDRDGIKDFLFEFIIQAKLGNRTPILEESYREHFGVPKVFEKLRHVIIETDKTKAEKLLKEFITKEWYPNHKDAGWYNSHKSPHNTYFGYWSFETAAVVKTMGLDDSSFRDCIYYPKDLVH